MSDKVVFLDRDGTINEEKGYLDNPHDLVLIDGAVEALRLLRQEGFRLIIITNQSGISRGYLTEDTLRKIHERLIKLLKDYDIVIDGIYYCPHLPDDGCGCRKPSTALIVRAVSELGLSIGRAYVVGDKVSDIEMAENAGAKGILVRTGYGVESEKELSSKPFCPSYIADDMMDAARWIIEDRES